MIGDIYTGGIRSLLILLKMQYTPHAASCSGEEVFKNIVSRYFCFKDIYILFLRIYVDFFL